MTRCIDAHCDELPIHSFRTLPANLATLAKNRAARRPERLRIHELTHATAVHKRALELLGVTT